MHKPSACNLYKCLLQTTIQIHSHPLPIPASIPHSRMVPLPETSISPTTSLKARMRGKRSSSQHAAEQPPSSLQLPSSSHRSNAKNDLVPSLQANNKPYPIPAPIPAKLGPKSCHLIHVTSHKNLTFYSSFHIPPSPVKSQCVFRVSPLVKGVDGYGRWPKSASQRAQRPPHSFSRNRPVC